jgi:CHAD domain-containing protein
MTSVKAQETVPGACIFGVQRVLPLLDAFLREIEGVRSGEDIEHIHRMRVASRRLRAALPLFKSCFPPGKFRVWVRELQKVTRALGNARDADVQIAFLECLKKRGAQKNSMAPSGAKPPAQPDVVEVILLRHLQKKRRKYQNAVLSALEDLEKSKIPDDIRAGCTDLVSGGHGARIQQSLQGIPPVAAFRISGRLNALLEFEQWVHDPDAIAEHHAMRIAAKKLRYTMEVYAPVYRRNLKKYLVRAKKIQEILGDLHDCDVWIDTVTAMLPDERPSSRSGIRHTPAKKSRETSYRRFLSERRQERKQIYRKFVTCWQSVGRDRLWDELRVTLIEGRKERFRLHENPRLEDIRSSALALSSRFSDGTSHNLTVTTLASRIFDDLASLHRMHAHERFLLECAAYLHDIGLSRGKKGHAEQSEEMILSDDTLAAGIIDRGMIGLISRAHSGRAFPESDGFFSLLSREQQKDVRMLASLLRVADGLDGLRLGSITSVHCSAGPQEVIIETTAIREATAEIKRAYEKGDLFTQVFERTLVIR